MIDTDKIILDACCGGRQWWFQKNNTDTVYMDIRQVKKGSISLQPNWSCEPDIIGDYREIPFKENQFNLVAWDIPHILKENKGIISVKYGWLGDNWKDDTIKGFNEIMRVLKPKGVLIFKYADINIKVSDMIDLFPIQPLFGTRTKKGVNNTYFLVYMKP
jgi:ubiquinone/menaquinone biosynthesis C-methylase UbiE